MTKKLSDELLEKLIEYAQSALLDGYPYEVKELDLAMTLEALRAYRASRVEPAANPSALKCPTCKRPMEEVKISELREYFESPADPAESLREIIEQIVADGGADQNSDAYLGEEMLARIRSALNRPAEPT